MSLIDREEKVIHDALSQMTVDASGLATKVKRKLNEDTPRSAPRQIRRSFLIAAVMSMMLIVTVAAAALGGFDWLLEKVEVPFGDVVDPTYQSVESDGIKVSVIAKKSYSDMSVLYVTLEDTKGLGRVAGDTQIAFGTNDLTQRYSSDLLYFDSETGIAAFEVRLGARDTFDGQTLALEIEGLSYSNQYIGEIRMDFDLVEAVANGENIGEPYADSTRAPSESLTIGHVADIPETKSAWISSIGVLHGYLTVQIGQPASSNMFMRYNSLRPYLLDPDGNVVESKPWSTGFSRTEDMQNIEDFSQVAYYFEEYYFDVDTDALEGYTLCFDATTREIVESNWTLEVDFDSVTEVVEITTDIDVDGVQMKDVTLTLHPLGMTLVGNGASDIDYGAPITAETVIETTDGDIKLISLDASRPHPEKEFECTWQAYSTIDMDSVIAIRIGDNRIEIQ